MRSHYALRITALVCFLHFYSGCKTSKVHYVGGLDSSTQTIIRSASDNDQPYGSYLEEYFSDLEFYFPYNPNNYCVFVALSMMLSYYDTWWNNDIVSDEYIRCSEGQSPGVDYCEEDYNLACNTFMNRLVLLSTYPSIESGVTNERIPFVCDNAIQGIGADSHIRLSDPCQDMELLYDLMDHNQPVMLIARGFPLDHALVGYKHEGNIIYAHNGYSDSSEYGRLVICNAELYGFLYMELIGEHKCSDNYNNGRCPYHENSTIHDLECIHYDENNHSLLCWCGYRMTKESHWNEPPLILDVGYQHHLACASCSYNWLGEHFPFVSTEWDSEHTAVWCYCGYLLGMVEN